MANKLQTIYSTSVLTDSCKVGSMSSTLRIRSRKAIPTDCGQRSVQRISQLYDSRVFRYNSYTLNLLVKLFN